MFRRLLAVILATALGIAGAQARTLVVAATTSVEDSGLFDYMLPKFTARTGVTVRVVSRATGQALISAERGLIDVVIVNDPMALDRFVDSGEGVNRRKLMFNDFIIAGPASDPAGLRASKDAATALRNIARLRAPFLSRGDNSGTHQAEMRLWDAAKVNPKTRTGNWYIESGHGMGLSVDMAARLKAYVLTDRATWLRRRPSELEVMVENDPRLFNQYEIVLVNPAKHPHVDAAAATEFINWLVSTEGQAVIGSYRIGGARAFIPNAGEQN
jgi:tungstate transport system substrate-binding protein